MFATKNQSQQKPTNTAIAKEWQWKSEKWKNKKELTHISLGLPCKSLAWVKYISYKSVALPVPQRVSSYRAEPANWGQTPRAVGVEAGVGAVLDGDCLHSLSSPAPPAGEKPVSVPPPQPAWLSLLPWLTVLHGHGTPLHLLSAQPMTTRGRIQNIHSKLTHSFPQSL